jgi:putative sigma-54 modulation protein
MNIDVHSKNIPVSDRVQEYAEKKLDRLERFLPNILDASLELRVEKQRGKDQPIAQLTIRNSRGTVLRAEDKTQADIFAAIDEVVDKMYSQIVRYKGKSKKRKGNERWIEAVNAWEGFEDVPLDESVQIDDYDHEPRLEVLRRKAIALAPMSEMEAIDQMELLGHDFFVFYNGEEDSINVLYRRKDGNYGILTPQVD